jgi:hypothetical protein
MKTARPFLLLLIAILLGWTLGSYTTENFYKKWINRYQLRMAFDGVSERLAVLNAVRAGDTNGTAAFLEGQLDGQIKVLDATVRELHVDQLPPRGIQQLEQLQDYRAKHPPTTNDLETDRIISGILSLTNAQNRP